jgi:outer membrane protein OmpA-like peptidoglycan-associated protein/uncharacterized protein YidB (DUF937 family)
MTVAMTAFDNLTHDLEGKFGVGSAAQSLMRELLNLMSAKAGGISGFLDRFRSAGLGSEVASFVGGGSAAALSAKTVDTVLGEGTVDGIAQRVGLEHSQTSSALGYEIPKVIGLLTPGGRVPAALPSEFQSLLGSAERMRPEAMVGTVRAAAERPASSLWVWPLLGLLLLGGLLYWAFAPRVTPVTTGLAAVNVLTQTLTSTVLNFAEGSAQLPAASAPALQQAADQIKGMPAGTVIEIAGHTDNVGDASANMTLSQQRADSVRNALVRDGVNPAMLVAKGYGDTRPIASNDTSNGRLRNRRIEFTLH